MQSIPEAARKLALEFIDFVNVAVTPFHVVRALSQRLKGRGFSELRENDNWDLVPGGKYFFTRNLTTLVAFTVGDKFDPDNTGFKVIGAHTDSPCLRLAPVSKLQQVGINQMCINTYGGGLWHTWLDRYPLEPIQGIDNRRQDHSQVGWSVAGNSLSSLGSSAEDPKPRNPPPVSRRT